MHVRRATIYDIPEVFALAEQGYAESRYARYALRPEKFRRLADMAEADPEHVVCLVALDRDMLVVGFLCGIITEHYFADMIYATNLALFVSPNARGSRAAFNLIRGFERMARERGAAEVMLGATSGVKADRTAKLYNAAGFQTVGALTVKYIGE